MITVTNDNSIVFANTDVRKAAEDAVSLPSVRTQGYDGPITAMKKNMPEKIVEYTESTIVVTENQEVRLPLTPRTFSHL